MKLLLARLRAIHGALPRGAAGHDRPRAARPSPRRCCTTSGTVRSRTSSRTRSPARRRTRRGRSASCSTRRPACTPCSPPSTRRFPRASSSWCTDGTSCPYLAKAVSGELDVDRCDYLLRDAHATGRPLRPLRSRLAPAEPALRAVARERAARRSRSTAPRGCRPSRRSSRRASSCSSRCTCTSRRAPPSG